MLRFNTKLTICNLATLTLQVMLQRKAKRVRRQDITISFKCFLAVSSRGQTHIQKPKGSVLTAHGPIERKVRAAKLTYFTEVLRVT